MESHHFCAPEGQAFQSWGKNAENVSKQLLCDNRSGWAPKPPREGWVGNGIGEPRECRVFYRQSSEHLVPKARDTHTGSAQCHSPWGQNKPGTRAGGSLMLWLNMVVHRPLGSTASVVWGR